MKSASIPRLDTSSILKALHTKRLGRSLLIVERCDSTNDLAAKSALDGAPHGFTVIAEEQTKGRGRQGRVWLSPRGGIWMTIIIRPTTVFDVLNALPLAGALAIARAINSILNIQALVRWPNDVVVDDFKLAGVLAEARFRGNLPEFALLGLGVNANFHKSLIGATNEKSTSVLDVLGWPIDRIPLICSMLLETEQLYDSLCSGEAVDVLELLKGSESSLGRSVVVKVPGETIVGIVEDYESLTRVRISREDGSHVTVETGSVISVEYADDRSIRVQSKRP